MLKLHHLLVFLVVLLLASQGLGVQTSAEDLGYLRRFAAATGADQALGWNAGSDPCNDSWSGVRCDRAGKVTSIHIQDKQLHGTVPDAAGNSSLSSLGTLNMGGNSFTGKVPVLRLPQLQTLRLDSNSFTTMPANFFLSMPSLQECNLTNNSALAGWALPDGISSLTQLRQFEARDAGINGTLHGFFSNGTAGFPFPSLVQVSLAANRLSGTVPELKGSVITQLDLSNDELTGSINFISDIASSAEQLQLSHNMFTGPLPDFSEFTSLAKLYVDHNQITGVVPPSLPRLETIILVHLSGNLLQGPVPEFDRVVDTDVAKAVATGSFCRLDHRPCDPEVESLLLIAGGFGYPQNLAASWMRNDPCAGWIGVHCDDRRRVTGINLSRLGLSGTMASAFGSLRSLQAIDLSGNSIVGDIPASVAQLPSLHVVDVSNNKLDGTMPKFPDHVAVWIEGNPGLKISGSYLSAPSTVGFFVILVVTLVPFIHF